MYVSNVSDQAAWHIANVLLGTEFPLEILGEVQHFVDVLRPTIRRDMPVIIGEHGRARVESVKGSKLWVEYSDGGMCTVDMTEVTPDWSVIEAAQDDDAIAGPA